MYAQGSISPCPGNFAVAWPTPVGLHFAVVERMYHLNILTATYVSKYFNVLNQPLSSYPRPLRMLRGTAGPLSLWTESRGIAGSRRFKDGSPSKSCSQSARSRGQGARL